MRLEPNSGFKTLVHFSMRRVEARPWHCACFARIMMDFVLSILAVIAGGVLLEVFAAAMTPSGDRREKGFRLGTEVRMLVKDFPTGNPS